MSSTKKPKLALCAAKKNFEFLWIQLTIEPDMLNFSTTKLVFAVYENEYNYMNYIKNQGFSGWISMHMNN